MPENTSPVFILGLPRSASKWIMHSINEYTDICMIHELHIKRLWRRGNHSKIKSKKKMSSANDRIQYLRNKTKRDEFIGCFWRMKDADYVFNVLTDEEINLAFSKVVDGWSMLDAMMEIQKIHYRKERTGARHPVHFIYICSLLNRYPDARVIFLTRSVSKISASWRRKLIGPETYFLKRVVFGIMITIQVYLNAFLTLPILYNFQEDDRILHIKFEEIVQEPEKEFSKICDHLMVSYTPGMADDSIVYDSAFQ